MPVPQRWARVRRVLLAEDNPGDIAAFERVVDMHKDRFQLKVVTDGVQALDFLRKQGRWEDAWTPDLVVLNINLSKMNGFDVCDTMKADPALRSIPVVIWSVSEREEDVVRAFEGECSGLFRKPFPSQDLEAVVSSILEFYWRAWPNPLEWAPEALPYGKKERVPREGANGQALSTQVTGLRRELSRVDRRVGQLEALITRSQGQTTQSAALKLAYIDARDVFGVFVHAVSDLRQSITDKDKAIRTLKTIKTKYVQEDMSVGDYTQQLCKLSAELLSARMSTAVGALDRMIASKEFLDLRDKMLSVRKKAQPLMDDIDSLALMIRMEVISAMEFMTRHLTVSQKFKQFDEFVTTMATTKLVQATDKVAKEHGYALVIRRKDVIMYRDQARIDDITDLVKTEIQGYL